MKFIWILNTKNNTKILALDSGKYKYENVNEIPDDYLGGLIENYSKTHDVENLFTAQNALEIKMARICEEFDLRLEDYYIPIVTLEKEETPKSECKRKLTFRRRP